jgi:hypothetical protein
MGLARGEDGQALADRIAAQRRQCRHWLTSKARENGER